MIQAPEHLFLVIFSKEGFLWNLNIAFRKKLLKTDFHKSLELHCWDIFGHFRAKCLTGYVSDKSECNCGPERCILPNSATKTPSALSCLIFQLGKSLTKKANYPLLVDKGGSGPQKWISDWGRGVAGGRYKKIKHSIKKMQKLNLILLIQN